MACREFAVRRETVVKVPKQSPEKSGTKTNQRNYVPTRKKRASSGSGDPSGRKAQKRVGRKQMKEIMSRLVKSEPRVGVATHRGEINIRVLAIRGADEREVSVGHPSDCQALHSVAAASYLVDPASSHMLVSKIKPCMSKYKLQHSETANGSLNQLWFLRSYYPTWITVVILELIHDTQLRP